MKVPRVGIIGIGQSDFKARRRRKPAVFTSERDPEHLDAISGLPGCRVNVTAVTGASRRYEPAVRAIPGWGCLGLLLSARRRLNSG